MKNQSNYTFAFLTVALLLLGSVGYAIYTKYNTHTAVETITDDASKWSDISQQQAYEEQYESIEKESIEPASDIIAKVVNINTNAEKKTFIKVNSFSDRQDYILLTGLEPNVLDINLGDIVSFSDTLNKSRNGAYYFVNEVSDYRIVEKNTEVYNKLSTIKISEIKESMQGQDILVKANISGLRTSKKGHSFFDINDENSVVKGVLFNSEANQLEERLILLNNYNDTSKTVSLEGKVNIYKGDLQIIVSKVYN